jgi:hypothetical protein
MGYIGRIQSASVASQSLRTRPRHAAKAAAITRTGRLIRVVGAEKYPPPWLTKMIVPGDVLRYRVPAEGSWPRGPRFDASGRNDCDRRFAGADHFLLAVYDRGGVSYEQDRAKSDGDGQWDAAAWERGMKNAPVGASYGASALILVRSVFRVVESVQA